MYIKSKTYIKDNELFSALEKSLEGKSPKKVLILPPDYTRMYSGAGKITAMYYDILKDKCEIDIMPALGTHEPMTKAEW
ncbi:MAG: D-mannonate epimerase, partial [Clostridia bacterium]|nr:D-mannonate epimerase [Clostridia bacterium]